MKKRSLLLSGLMLAYATNTYALPYGFSDARSVAMGNVSIATGGVTTAAFSNPAMLMVNETDDTFALHIGVGAVFIEDGNIVDDIDEFQVVSDRIDARLNSSDVSNPANATANATALVDDLNTQIQLLENLNGDSLVGRAAPNFALVYGGDDFSVAVTVGADAYVSGAIEELSITPGDDPLTIEQVAADLVLNGDLTINPTGTLSAVGAVTTEVGIAIAKDFSLFGMDVSLGVKPKVVSAEAIVFRESLDTVDTADIIDDTAQDLGSFTTVDAGAVIGLTDSIRVGLVAKNLISETLTVNTNGASYDIDFDTHLRAGISYNNSFMTLAADMDLTETDPILVEDPTQMLALGVELNAFDYVQFRAGYQTNMASDASADDLISAGVGLWLGFNLDIAAVVSEDSVGAFVQTGFRF